MARLATKQGSCASVRWVHRVMRAKGCNEARAKTAYMSGPGAEYRVLGSQGSVPRSEYSVLGTQT